MLNTETILREVAEGVAHIHDARDRLAQQVGYLQRAIRNLSAQYTGEGQAPQAGCAFAKMTAGDAEVLVEYEYAPAEAPNYDADSTGAGPGCEASVEVLKALVNGKWVDLEDVFAESLIERWQEQIAESEAEQARDARESDDRDRYDDARDFAASQEERAELRGGAYAAAVRETA